MRRVMRRRQGRGSAAFMVATALIVTASVAQAIEQALLNRELRALARV